jgi:dihydroorotate dehydrogenase (NAD+) catalytic subunit
MPELPIIGVGGVASAKNAIEFFMAGASAVQIGSANFADPRISKKVITDLAKWCEDRQIESIEMIKGAAHRDET